MDNSNKKQFLYFSNEAYDKIKDLKAGIIWVYAASLDRPLTMLEISKHFEFSISFTKKSIRYLEGLDLIHQLNIEDKVFYKANPETYFHSDDSHDARNSNITTSV